MVARVPKTLPLINEPTINKSKPIKTKETLGGPMSFPVSYKTAL